MSRNCPLPYFRNAVVLLHHGWWAVKIGGEVLLPLHRVGMTQRVASSLDVRFGCAPPSIGLKSE